MRNNMTRGALATGALLLHAALLSGGLTTGTATPPVSAEAATPTAQTVTGTGTPDPLTRDALTVTRAAVATVAGEPPACEDEDGSGPGVTYTWDAPTRGNGVGASYVIDAAGTAHYAAEPTPEPCPEATAEDGSCVPFAFYDTPAVQEPVGPVEPVEPVEPGDSAYTPSTGDCGPDAYRIEPGTCEQNVPPVDIGAALYCEDVEGIVTCWEDGVLVP
jgi:hypothetical protein